MKTERERLSKTKYQRLGENRARERLVNTERDLVQTKRVRLSEKVAEIW